MFGTYPVLVTGDPVGQGFMAYIWVILVFKATTVMIFTGSYFAQLQMDPNPETQLSILKVFCYDNVVDVWL